MSPAKKKKKTATVTSLYPMRERERESYYSVVGVEESRWGDLSPGQEVEVNLRNTWHKSLLFLHFQRLYDDPNS